MKSILQTEQWAKFKHSQGLEILKLGELFIHKKSLPSGQNFLYIPEASAHDINGGHIDQLKALSKKNNSIFLRLELVDHFGESAHKLLLSFGFRPGFEQVQPKWRQLINLEHTRGELLAQMKQKGRYNIKLAERKGVKIRHLDGRGKSAAKFSEMFQAFYSLYSQTNTREKLAGRTKQYFVDMIDNFSEEDYLEIYIASFENIPIAAALVSFYDGVASYLYGGSSVKHREVMAPYLMHWQIICDAKEREMKRYDLIGRAKPGDENSAWAGITRFKEQFGGETIEILGSYDFISKPFWYQIFKIAEKMRRG